MGYQMEFWLPEKHGECERCSEVTWLCYSPTGSAAEGAEGFWACQPCDEEHQEYWDEMWSEYYASQGF